MDIKSALQTPLFQEAALQRTLNLRVNSLILPLIMRTSFDFGYFMFSITQGLRKEEEEMQNSPQSPTQRKAQFSLECYVLHDFCINCLAPFFKKKKKQTHICILFYILFHYDLSQDIEYTTCCAVSRTSLFIYSRSHLLLFGQ